jgi:hypothetical protein
MTTSRFAAAMSALGIAILAASVSLAPAQSTTKPALAAGAATQPAGAAATAAPLRPIRVAVFDFEVLKGIDLEPAALTDQVNGSLAALAGVTIVNRDQIKKVADEHKASLAGVIDSDSAVQLGKFLAAQYVIVGRASKLDQANSLLVKIVDVSTTVQTTISAKAPAAGGASALIESLNTNLAPKVKELQKPVKSPADDPAFAKLTAAAKPLVSKVFLVDISETHINRPLVDPAAQMAVANRLRSLGVEVLIPTEAPDGWKKSLLETGKFGDKKVDFMVEGEGTSAYAAQMEGLISCRARVELRVIAVPGRNVTLTDKGIGAKADLVEALAAKAALEEAGVKGIDAIVMRWPAK